MTVCYVKPGSSIFVRGGGTTYGTIFLKVGDRRPGAALIMHEWKHAKQWALYGSDFINMYATAAFFGLGNPCWNEYEQEAGLADGGYIC